MGAGNASATLYKCDPNIPTGGGNKKQGITSRVGLDNWENREVQTRANGIGRFKLFFVNQLGGVETGHSMFGGRYNRGDGLRMSLYPQQLQEEIKDDKHIYPENNYVSGIRGTSSCSTTLTKIKEDNGQTQFATSSWCIIFNSNITELTINGSLSNVKTKTNDNYVYIGAIDITSLSFNAYVTNITTYKQSNQTFKYLK